MQKFDCVIVGFGPVGALLSLFLSRLQLKVAIIDKNVDIYPLPRAIHFDQEVMRIFQMIGLNEKVSAISLDENLSVASPRAEKSLSCRVFGVVPR